MRWRESSSEPTPSPSRLNLLVSYGGWQEQPAVEQLARVLRPLGIDSFTASSGQEAAEMIEQLAIHIAIVDLMIPLERAEASPAPAPPGGGRILQLLRRLEAPPPTVIVRPSRPERRTSARELSDALREGAFAVVDRPMHLETMLEVLRRIVRRCYADHWPADRGRPETN